MDGAPSCSVLPRDLPFLFHFVCFPWCLFLGPFLSCLEGFPEPPRGGLSGTSRCLWDLDCVEAWRRFTLACRGALRAASLTQCYRSGKTVS